MSKKPTKDGNSQRLAILFLMHIKSVINRVRYDLAKEIVVLICSTVLLALFYYIFNDFLNNKIASLSTNMQQKLSQYVCGILFFIITLACGKHLAILKTKSLDSFAFIRGESQNVIAKYNFLIRFITLLAFHGVAWAIARHILHTFGSFDSVVAIIMMVLSILLSRLFSTRQAGKDRVAETFSQSSMLPLAALIHWRKKHLFKRNRLALFCLILSIILTCLSLLAATSSKPEMLGFVISLISGCVASSAVSLQIAEDLNFSWAEQSFGVTHNQMIQAIDRICLQMALFLGVLTGICLYISTQLFENQMTIIQITQLMFVTSVPIFLTGSLSFQIDARRPAIPILSVVLISLFVATAIFAHIAAVILIPIVSYYSKTNQIDRYYRA